MGVSDDFPVHPDRHFWDQAAVQRAPDRKSYEPRKSAATRPMIRRGINRPNLAGNVQETAFMAPCDGNGSNTGKRLTMRRNWPGKRTGK